MKGRTDRPDAAPNLRGEGGPRRGQAHPAGEGNAAEGEQRLLERVLQRENLFEALRRVQSNKGAPGVDGMTVEQLGDYLREHWTSIREDLYAEKYRPKPVRKVEIPKPGGGVRTLGIPTVLDRLIQQALYQILEPIFDPTFSDGSFGFRRGRGTHDAVRRMRKHLVEGQKWVVDLDLEKFFDYVNHDVLMARVARRVKDKRVLRLIRRYLRAGLMEGGLVSPRDEGTPQGGPLSPLLSNILLDDLDKELERRGHRFVRYADDCNVYVRSEAAGQRVMASLERFLRERLRLKVNRAKSAVARPSDRKFLGYSVTRQKPPKLKVSPQSERRLKDKLRTILCAGRGRALAEVIRWMNPILVGWRNYFRLVESKGAFMELDKWVRRKLRCILWRQWKNPRTRYAKLMKRGASPGEAARLAFNGRGPWHNARWEPMKRAVPDAELRKIGLVSLVEEQLPLKWSV
jgi:RNA-directed DNA polymerase